MSEKFPLQEEARLSDFVATWGSESDTPFLERFAALDQNAWQDKLLAALKNPVQDGIAFPRMPPPELQMRVHGHTDETALRESISFYRAISAHAEKLQAPLSAEQRVLDFGSGWGRTIMPFIHRIDLRNLFGFEPNPTFRQVARLLNPYVNFVGGNYHPPTIFAAQTFDVIVSWSVFTHLPIDLSRGWLKELTRILRPGGLLFFTVWGKRFVSILRDADRQMKARKEVHWFYKQVLENAGDLDDLERRQKADEVVFIPSVHGPDWGDTLMTPAAARTLMPKGLEQVAYDGSMLGQDLMVFRRS